MSYIYGPIPSRRLGLSLGISPIPKKACNYSCIYCQLGRTNPLTNERKEYFPLSEILKELDEVLSKKLKFDVISIVGEGEPTLHSGLGTLVTEIKKRTTKPVTIITNSALLYDEEVRREVGIADIVLPSLDSYDEESFKKINRPIKRIRFEEVFQGLKAFTETFQGNLWLEIMLMSGINDSDEALFKFKDLLKELKYDRLYLNTPVRPPAEKDVKPISEEKMRRAVEILGGISIDLMNLNGFQSGISDDYEAIFSIIRRHPMNQHEIKTFLHSRSSTRADEIIKALQNDERVEAIEFKGFQTFRLK